LFGRDVQVLSSAWVNASTTSTPSVEPQLSGSRQTSFSTALVALLVSLVAFTLI
jgi:hypothetical protein